MAHTFKPNENIERYVQENMFRMAARIDDSAAIVVKPKPFWMPRFIYDAVIRSHVEIVQDHPFYMSAAAPQLPKEE